MVTAPVRPVTATERARGPATWTTRAPAVSWRISTGAPERFLIVMLARTGSSPAVSRIGPVTAGVISTVEPSLPGRLARVIAARNDPGSRLSDELVTRKVAGVT